MKYPLAALVGLGFSSLALAGPGAICRDKAELRHAAKLTVHVCMDSWAHDGKPQDPDPSEDCSAKLAAFIQAAKDVKACHLAQGSKPH